MPAARIHVRTMQLLVAVAAVVCAVMMRASWIVENGWLLLVGMLAFQAYLALDQPAWLSGRDGGADHDNPFSPFRRWTWTTPPEHWKHAVRSSLVCGLLVFPGMALGVYVMTSEHPQWGYIAFFILLSLELTFSAIRIWARVRFVKARSSLTVASDSTPP